MNRVILMGRLTRDPDIRYSANTNVCIARYTLAVDRPVNRDAENANQQTADFINCVALGKSGEFAEKYLKKGMKMAVEGRIQTGSYTKDDGTKAYTTDVIIDRHEFCESKNAGGNRALADEALVNNAGVAGVATDENGFVSVAAGIDEELPFG